MRPPGASCLCLRPCPTRQRRAHARPAPFYIPTPPARCSSDWGFDDMLRFCVELSGKQALAVQAASRFHSPGACVQRQRMLQAYAWLLA